MVDYSSCVVSTSATS